MGVTLREQGRHEGRAWERANQLNERDKALYTTTNSPQQTAAALSVDMFILSVTSDARMHRPWSSLLK